MRVKLLGFILTRDGIKMDPEKLEALDKFECPRTPQQVRTFLGKVNFYRFFCEHLGTIAAPLNELLKKNPAHSPKDPVVDAAFNAIMAELYVAHLPSLGRDRLPIRRAPSFKNRSARLEPLRWRIGISLRTATLLLRSYPLYLCKLFDCHSLRSESGKG